MPTRRTSALSSKMVIGLALALFLVISIFVACTKSSDTTIKIGRISPMTGDGAQWGKWLKDGIDLAVDETNAAGGIDGRKLSVIYEDDKADPKLAASAMEKLISSDKVRFVLGPETSGAVLAAAPIAERNKVILLTSGAASPKISQAGDFIFRIFPTSIHEAQSLLSISKTRGFKRAVILFVTNDYGVGIQQIMARELPTTGVQVVLDEGYDIGRKDFRTLILKAKEAKPDVTFLLGYPDDMALLLRQSRELGFATTFVAPSTFEVPIIVPIAGQAAEGVIFVYPDLPAGTARDTFAAAFKAKYGAEPITLNGYAYDGAKLLFDAIRRGGADPLKVRDALYATKGYQGVTGSIDMDRNGDVMGRAMVANIVQQGRAVLLRDN